MVAEIEHGAVARGLSIVQAVQTRLTDDDVRILFPVLHRDLCPITPLFLSYLTDDEVRFLVLAGPDAVSRASTTMSATPPRVLIQQPAQRGPQPRQSQRRTRGIRIDPAELFPPARAGQLERRRG